MKTPFDGTFSFLMSMIQYGKYFPTRVAWAIRLQLMRILSAVLLSFWMLAASAQVPETISKWMTSHYAKLFVRINQYNTEQYNLLVNQTRVPLTENNQTVRFQNSEWSVGVKAVPVVRKKDAVEYTVTFTCLSGRTDASSVSVDIDWGMWSEKNFVLMPATAYNGNRYEWRRLRYSPKLYEVQDIGPEKPIILTDVPKLNGNGAVSRIQARSGDMSVPSIGFLSDTVPMGAWMLTGQGNELGDYGIDIAENRSRNRAIVSITSPIVREQYVYKICDAHYPSWDKPKDFLAGDKVTFKFRIYAFQGTQVAALYDKYAEIRKDMTDTAGSLLANAVSYSSCMELLEKKYNEKNFEPKHGYYSVGFRENFLQDWQIGWTGGMISTYPLLFSGSEATRSNVLRNFDWLFPNGISPSGFYWDAGRNGTEWLGGDIRKPHTKDWHLVRKSGDAVWYITKQFQLMEKMSISVKPAWKEGNQKVLDAFVTLWDKNHQLGQFVNSQNGAIMVGGSCSGGIVPAGLALAAKYYAKPMYLNKAKEIGQYFYDSFTVKGLTYGGPGDAVQNFDSESALGLLESYVTLFETTGEKKWVGYAKDAAKQLSTWVVGYNYRFPASSVYGQANIRVNGSVYANTQNKHTAPGLCTASGVGLLKLYRATGDQFYLGLLQDIAHNITQYIGHPQKPLGTLPEGYISERVNMSDWEGPGTIGYVLPLSTWAETSLMLTTMEVPGLYIETDKGQVTAFDNVAVSIVSNTTSEMVIDITNPTPTDANVKLWIERSGDKSKPLGENYLYGAQTIMVKAGAVKRYTVKK